MKTNIGSFDKIVRFALAAIFIALFFVLDGALRYIGLLGLVFLGTALLGFCPLYAILGLSSCPLNSKK